MASIVAGGSRGGSSVFGTKPKTVSTPSAVADLRRVTPFYDEMNDLISGNILAGLQGMLPASVTQSVLDAANSRAVAGGFGGSGLGNNLGVRDLGLTSKAIQDLAFNQALNFVGNQSKTATVNPALQTDIDQFNSLVRAAPDPTARANWEMEQVTKLLNPATQGGQLPFGSATTPVPSGGTSSTFKPIRDWGAPNTTLGVNPYVPNFYTPGSNVSGTRVDPPVTKPFVPSGNATWDYNDRVQATQRMLDTQHTSTPPEFRNMFNSMNGQADALGILNDLGIDPSLYGGTYNPATDQAEWDTWSTYDPFATSPF